LTLPKSLGGVLVSSELEGVLSLSLSKTKKERSICKLQGPMQKIKRRGFMSNPSFLISPMWSKSELDDMKILISSKEASLGKLKLVLDECGK
jgi:hypothetical protein